jgi:hypothetical protein
MALPIASAEASLYRSQRQYHLGRGLFRGNRHGTVRPAMEPSPWGVGASNKEPGCVADCRELRDYLYEACDDNFGTNPKNWIRQQCRTGAGENYTRCVANCPPLLPE